MNSAPSSSDRPSASPASASARPSNLKSRWKRDQRPATPGAKSPTTPAVCGEVSDISSARESLSGEHIHGYKQPESAPVSPRPAPAPVAAPVRMTRTPEEPRSPYAPPPDLDARTPAQHSDSRPARQDRPPEPRREAPPQHRRDETSHRRPDNPSEPRRDGRRPEQPRQPGRDGQREQYVGLKPDPANETSPRRLRTENSKQVPIEEYVPSALSRRPDKPVPAKSSRESSRDRAESSRSSREPIKAHASIPARIATEVTPKPKSRGIIGFIKRALGLAKTETKSTASSSRSDSREHSRRDDHGDDRRDHQRSGEGEDRGHRRRRRGGRGRHSHGSGESRRSSDS